MSLQHGEQGRHLEGRKERMTDHDEYEDDNDNKNQEKRETTNKGNHKGKKIETF
jgi:hypothetical protein